MKDVAIRVGHVSKDFLLPHEKVNSVKSFFVNPFQSRRAMQKDVQHALNNINFDIKKGEFFGIVGRNGSGKSTLLKIIAGIYQPTKGEVWVNGRLVPFIELGVGFNPELTGRENIYLNGALMGFSEAEIDAMYDDIVKFAELEQFMDQKLKNYSSGMQVRLAFSVATRADTDILLIDEVLAVGDADFQRKCFSYFKKLKKDKKTVVFVSHDMNAIREYCDRAVLIEHSKLIFEGSAEATSKEYTRLFLPSLYEAQVEEDRARRESQLKDSTNSDSIWGAGGVDITNIRLGKTVYTQKDEFIDITYTMKSLEGFSGLIMPGMSIKNEQGTTICGTNSVIVTQKHDLLELSDSRKKISCTWRVPNIFNSGSYSLDVTVTSIDSNTVLQWREDAASFRVDNERNTPYVTAPNIQLVLPEKQ